MQVMLTGEPVDTSKATLKGKWKKIIQKCTQINPEKRYQTVQELKEDIQRQGSSYHFQGILRGIPGFRPKEKKYRRAIFLFGYPLTILWAAKISQEIFRNIKLPMPQFALWYVGAMFFSTGIPVILLADLFQIRTKLFQRKKYSKGTKVAISIAIGYVSVMVLGVMLALYYNL